MDTLLSNAYDLLTEAINNGISWGWKNRAHELVAKIRAQPIQNEPLKWYNEQEVAEFLHRNKESVSNNLAGFLTIQLQLAFNKGWRKANNLH